MSKWKDDFENAKKDIKAVKDVTKEIIGKGGKLALEKFHDANSVERLKKEIRGNY